MFFKEKDDWIIDTDRSKISHIVKKNAVFRLGLTFDVKKVMRAKVYLLKSLIKNQQQKNKD